MIIDLVKKNRSCRGYNHSRKMTEQELLELVECARLCASSVNAQPLKYYMAWEEDEVARIQALTGWAKGLPELTLPHPGKEPAAFIIICQDFDIAKSETRHQRDVGVAAQTMLLAAVEKGLGGCMIGNFSPKRVSEELGLPENIVPRLIVALGEPDETVVIKEVDAGEPVNYYRDENDVHYVPKRKLKDVVITKESFR